MEESSISQLPDSHWFFELLKPLKAPPAAVSLAAVEVKFSAILGSVVDTITTRFFDLLQFLLLQPDEMKMLARLPDSHWFFELDDPVYFDCRNISYVLELLIPLFHSKVP